MKLLRSTLTIMLMGLPAVAMAHPGGEGLHNHSWLQGLMHPFVGIDHLIAMLAVGVWAAQLGGRARWQVPAAFIGVMMIGAGMGMSGVAVPYVEQGIIVSLLILGALIAFTLRLPLGMSSSLVGVFALFHGVAHGMELPASSSAFPYIAGFVFATALLHGAGLLFGDCLHRVAKVSLNRYAGAIISAVGLWMALG